VAPTPGGAFIKRAQAPPLFRVGTPP
jgi:hypothetical protein